jgi:5'-3' exonuclease
MDGPAPLAKLLEQRRRRKKEADRTMDNEENSDGDGDIIEGGKEEGEMGDSFGEVEVSGMSVYGQKAGKHKSRNSWKRKMKESPNRVSSLFLTTGTLFMLEVHNSLKCYILNRLADPKFGHLEFEFSDSTVKGEGELKIISRLIHHSDPEESHAVVGADSDLLLMTMIACKPNVFVVDDLPKRKAQGPKQKRHQRVFKSDALKKIWKNSLLEGDPGREDISSIARDLTLIAVLCSGNGEFVSYKMSAFETKKSSDFLMKVIVYACMRCRLSTWLSGFEPQGSYQTRAMEFVS